METSKEQVAIVFIDCPVCCSGNRFRLENPGVEIACEDCGFALAEAHELKAVDFERCVFCGGESFYLESPLSLSLLGKDSVCYVCGAKYKGVRMNNPDQKYSPEIYGEAEESEATKIWRERVDRYNRGAG